MGFGSIGRALALLPFLTLPCAAADDAAITAALDRGLVWLKGRQEADGAFRCHWMSEGYKAGETALALLTLLKAGTDPEAPEVERGFRWLLAQPPQRIYEVSTAILALEARFTPPPEESIKDEAPLADQIRRRFAKKAPGPVRDWLAQMAEFITVHQDKSGLWRYPFYGDPDVSNTQFAILALKAAERMGVKVAPESFLRAATALVDCQEKSGPAVATFSVPAADEVIQGLHDKRARQKGRRKSERPTTGGGTRVRDPEHEETRSVQPMKARGWGYKPHDPPRASMTTAGLAILVVCKSQLESNSGYAERLGPQVDQALRDGAAWVASRFAVDKNPGADPDWLFYYLYTLERAGTLLALDRFGPHDWYLEGSRAILARQQGDGRFVPGNSGQQDGELAGHCLAMLFLERSTVPVLKRVVTGGGTGAGAPAPSASGPVIAQRPDGQRDVTFRFRAAPGQRVTVAGSWNRWDSQAAPLQDPDGDGLFEGTLTLPAGSQQYKFVVDGSQWQPDPSNPRQAPDGHGGQNSLLEG